MQSRSPKCKFPDFIKTKQIKTFVGVICLITKQQSRTDLVFKFLFSHSEIKWLVNSQQIKNKKWGRGETKKNPQIDLNSWHRHSINLFIFICFNLSWYLMPFHRNMFSDQKWIESSEVGQLHFIIFIFEFHFLSSSCKEMKL